MANPRDRVHAGDLTGALESLAPIQRELLRLSTGEGLSNDEIAARTQLSIESVERQLADALIALDVCLERQNRPWWKFW